MMTLLTASRVRAALVAGIGAIVLFEGMNYNIGTLRRIGPGMLPVSLGVAFLVFSLFLFFEKDRADDAARDESLAIRPFVLVCLGVALFAALIDRFGFVPATFAACAVSALGDDRNRPLAVLLIASAFTAASVVVFIFGLGLPFRPIRW